MRASHWDARCILAVIMILQLLNLIISLEQFFVQYAVEFVQLKLGTAVCFTTCVLQPTAIYTVVVPAWFRRGDERQ